eukprot:6624117-Pyramimonas_sp.AAC.1
MHHNKKWRARSRDGRCAPLAQRSHIVPKARWARAFRSPSKSPLTSWSSSSSLSRRRRRPVVVVVVVVVG